jgi:hypothetical protein
VGLLDLGDRGRVVDPGSRQRGLDGVIVIMAFCPGTDCLSAFVKRRQELALHRDVQQGSVLRTNNLLAPSLALTHTLSAHLTLTMTLSATVTITSINSCISEMNAIAAPN